MEVLALQGWIPVAAFFLSLVTSMAGVSGAFLLLPFLVSVLGIATPSVSATSHLYNVIAIPGGVYRFVREGRLVWPLVWTIVTGVLPGVAVGVVVRLQWLADVADFKRFVGLVLALLALRVLVGLLRSAAARTTDARGLRIEALPRLRWDDPVRFVYDGQLHAAGFAGVVGSAFLVGVVGGIYGLGGGALLAPILVGVFRLPVHAIAGATLLATLLASSLAVVLYQGLVPFYPTLVVAPDWWLGLLLGSGGALGIYAGARLQKHVPARPIQWLLLGCMAAVAWRYLG